MRRLKDLAGWVIGFFVMTVSSGQAAVYTVTTNADSGAGSLRQCIADADATPDQDYIYFNAVGTISLASGLVINGDNLIIGDSAADQIVLDIGTLWITALRINSSRVTVRYLSIIQSGAGYQGTGIMVAGGDYAEIQSCRIGTDWSNGVGQGLSTGIIINTSSNTRIGGDTAALGNVISGNTIGIQVSDSDHLTIQANLIGTDSTGNAIMGNSYGVILGSGTTYSRIGGITGVTRNIICGSPFSGIEIRGGANATFGNTVNAVRMNVFANGSVHAPNFDNDILIADGAYGNFIGTRSGGAGGNLIYQAYVSVSGTATDYNGIYGNTLVATGATSTVIDLVHPGSNQGKTAPVISSALTGTISGTSAVGDYIEVFRSERAAGQRGGALRFLGSATADGSGNWSVIPSGLVGGEIVTALASDADNNTSEFAVNVLVPPPTPTSTRTPTFTATPTFTISPTATPTRTASPTATASITPSHSATDTATSTMTSTPSITLTATMTPTLTISPTSTISPTAMMTFTCTAMPTQTATPSHTRVADNPLLGPDLGGKAVVAYPNPAKDRMTFVFQLETAAKVEIRLYNLAGEQVAALSGDFAAGRGQSLVWNLADAAPGVYLARMLVNGSEKAKCKVAVAK